ncbi:MAG: CorA family divalent cation transporter [Rhodoblastus sp.]
MSGDRLKPALDVPLPGCNWLLRFSERGVADVGSLADLDALSVVAPGFIWLHLDRTDIRVREVLAAMTWLNAEAREALSGTVDHQYVEHVGDILSGAVVDHEQAFDGVHSSTDFLRFAVGRNFVVTSRRTPLYAPQALWRSLSEGVAVQTPDALFEMLINCVCECSAQMLRGVASVLDKIEENVVIEGRGRDQRASLGRARRKTVRLSRQISGLQSTLQRLEEAADAPEHSALADLAVSLGQRADSLARDAANLQDRARVLQEEINAILTLETNDRLYMLTILTAVLLPATFVTGYFGMNTKNLVFNESESGTLYATLLCVLASAGAIFLMRRLGITETARIGREPE